MLFQHKLKSLIAEALDIQDPKQRKRLVAELGVVLVTNFRSSENKKFVSDCNKLAQGKKVIGSKAEGKKTGPPKGFVSYKVGEKVGQTTKPSTGGSVVLEKGPAKIGEGDEGDQLDDDGREELEAIVAMENQQIKEHFGGMRNMKKWSKLQGFNTNQSLGGDKFITPFKVEVMALLAKIKLGKDPESEEEE